MSNKVGERTQPCRTPSVSRSRCIHYKSWLSLFVTNFTYTPNARRVFGRVWWEYDYCTPTSVDSVAKWIRIIFTYHEVHTKLCTLLKYRLLDVEILRAVSPSVATKCQWRPCRNSSDCHIPRRSIDIKIKVETHIYPSMFRILINCQLVIKRKIRSIVNKIEHNRWNAHRHHLHRDNRKPIFHLPRDLCDSF